MAKLYTPEHTWVDLDADVATVGISSYAQETLGDVVYVGLPELGQTFAQQAVAAVVESVKAASDIAAPLSGTVIAVNDALANDPSLVNASPLEEGWLFRLKLTATSNEINTLLSSADYLARL